METRTCIFSNCTNIFECRIDSSRKYCCPECYWKDMKGRKQLEETNRKRSKSMLGKNKGRYSNPELAAEVNAILSGEKEAPFCECGECGKRIEVKEYHRYAGIPKYIPGHHHKGKTYIEIYGECRASDEFCKRLKSMQLSPNIPEARISDILEKKLPGEYKYVGDGEVALGGKCPDFMNVNGQKKIIELFGDYWHGEKRTGLTNEQAEQERITHFAKYGYQTLIVWEHELEDTNRLKKKILEFNYE